jgi:DNA-binding NtrC family response regulator
MDALIYTADDREYDELKAVLEESGFRVERDPLDGHGHYEYGYSLVVAALEGARGMNVVSEYAERYPQTQVIWITGDRHFAKAAMQYHVSRFLERPYTVDRFREAVKTVLPKCDQGRTWHFRPHSDF